MATLSITAASVTSSAAGTGVIKQLVQAGETITGGMPVYKKASDGLWYKMQADGTGGEIGSGLSSDQMGVSLGGGTVGVWFGVQNSGPITIGATVSVGTHYYVHATAGLIGLLSDLSTGQYIIDLGYATTTAIILLGINATGLTAP